MKRLTMVLVFLAVGVLAGGGYWYWNKGGEAPAAEAGAGGEKQAKGKGKGKGKGGGGPVYVKAVQAVVKPMPVLIEAVGSVEAEQTVQVRAQVSGVLQSVQFKEGDRVKAGQLLFQLDPRTLQAQLNQALAQLERDRALLENAKAQQERLAPLLTREYITRQEYDVAVTSARSLEATMQANRAIAEQARIQLEYTRIRAPITGRTGTVSVQAGNLVSGNSPVPLVTINTLDPILVTFSLPERQLEEVRRYDKEMRIEILSDRNAPPVAEGKLVFIDNTVTPQTGTVLLKTRVSNAKESIWPGQFVNVRLVLTVDPEAVVVPEAAVQPGQDGSFVYMIDEKSRVRVQPVKVARQIGGEVVLADGVKGGDRVITEIPQTLQPGGAVQIAGEGGEKGKGKGKGKGKKESAEGSADGTGGKEKEKDKDKDKAGSTKAEGGAS